jgi:monothiol glutaredoxin
MIATRFVRRALAPTSRCFLFAAQTPQFNSLSMAFTRVQSRAFGSTDDNSHSDFQPQQKAQLTNNEIHDKIKQWVTENDVCVFMKGTRKMPQCGFSKFVVVLLNAYNVKNFKDVNVLADEKLREQIKLYSNWPTLPQVYIKGQFVGGCDIMKEMHEDGTLRELLIQHNIVKDSDAIGEVKR